MLKLTQLYRKIRKDEDVTSYIGYLYDHERGLGMGKCDWSYWSLTQTLLTLLIFDEKYRIFNILLYKCSTEQVLLTEGMKFTLEVLGLG